MLKYRNKAYSKHWPAKWSYINYKRANKHLNFNIYQYKDGHKMYSALSKEVLALFKKEKEQHNLWKKLSD